MKPNVSQQRHRGGFSLLELIIVMAVFVAILGATLPRLAVNKTSAKRISCVNTLRSIGTAFRLYANDYNGLYPYQVLLGAATNPVPPSAFGPFDTNNPANLWRLFQMAGNELSSPRILVCPSDTRRYADDFNEGSQLTANSFGHPTRRNQALSYFYGLNAREDDPNLLVIGDRHLTDQGTDIAPGRTYLQGIVTLGVPGPATAQPLR